MRLLRLDNPKTDAGGWYRIEPERQLRIEEYRGTVGLEQIRGVVTAMSSDPTWSPDFNGLIDFTGAFLDVTANDVLRLALLLKQDAQASRGWLVFVADCSLTHGVVRMLGFWMRAGDRLKIFGRRIDAEAWLDRNIGRRPPGFSPEPKDVPLRNVI